MKKRLRAFYLLISSVLLSILHFAFAIPKAIGTSIHSRALSSPVAGSPTGNPSDSLELVPAKRSVYDSLELSLKGLSREAYEYARQGFDRLLEEGRLLNDSIISIIDFSRPSSEKRLYILDVKNFRVLFNTLVSHGRNSGRAETTYFSNQHASYMSSPGFYITRETYQGKNGYSLKLEGLEQGINDNAYERGIVVHGAAYVSDALVNTQGYIGRSQGCPAVPVQLAEPVINRIRNGTCFFIYHPSYISRSVIL